MTVDTNSIPSINVNQLHKVELDDHAIVNLMNQKDWRFIDGLDDTNLVYDRVNELMVLGFVARARVGRTTLGRLA